MIGVSYALSMIDSRIRHIVALDWKLNDLEADIQRLEDQIDRKRIEMAETIYNKEASEQRLIDLYIEAEKEGYSMKKIAQHIKDAIISARRL